MKRPSHNPLKQKKDRQKRHHAAAILSCRRRLTVPLAVIGGSGKKRTTHLPPALPGGGWKHQECRCKNGAFVGWVVRATGPLHQRARPPPVSRHGVRGLAGGSFESGSKGTRASGWVGGWVGG